MTKYHAKPTTIDNVTFHSAKEARRYEELKILERAGEIAALQLQPRFPLDVNGKHVCYLVADFQYYSKEKQAYVVEDVKGYRKGTAYDLFKLKAKLFQACYGKEIEEV